MKKRIRIILFSIGAFIAVSIIALTTFIIVTIINDYKPTAVEDLTIEVKSENTLITKGTTYTIVTFNTGYAGLGEKQDFFMDGGKGSGAFNYEEVEKNTTAISNYLSDLNADFSLLQEVDLNSKRSHYLNQYDQYLTDQNRTFAYNYKNMFVPVPINRPMGKVESGIVTASKALPLSAQRYTFNGEESFFVQLFDLDRNFTITRYPVDDKQLVIINAHFSAYDKGGAIRQKQLAQMSEVLKLEYAAGNYVILGGDFNHELPGADSSIFTWTQNYPDWIQTLPTDFTPNGYNWAIDVSTPTVRDLMFPYIEGENFVAIIDGFLISDNIKVISTKTANLNFVNSDHNPVVVQFSLK